MSADYTLIALEERVDQILPRLSPTRRKALQTVAEGGGHELHSREIKGLEGWDLIRTSRVFGQKRPHSMWLTDLGNAVLARLAGEDDE